VLVHNQFPQICALFKRRDVHPHCFNSCASLEVSAHLMADT